MQHTCRGDEDFEIGALVGLPESELDDWASSTASVVPPPAAEAPGVVDRGRRPEDNDDAAPKADDEEASSVFVSRISTSTETLHNVKRQEIDDGRHTTPQSKPSRSPHQQKPKYCT